ncbi:MAG: PIG-L deacetylase family protein [Steroidobacteraceae bacterium]
MLELFGNLPRSSRVRILCFGAHCDDIEIGCAGALQSLLQRRPSACVDWVILSGSDRRRQEADKSMRRLIGARHRGVLEFGEFPDGSFPAHYGAIKAFFEALKARPSPDLIFCHERADRHQDHRIVNEMVWSTFRDHLVLEYEVPKWDGNLFEPNVYVPVTRAQLDRKVRHLLAAYASQRSRDWFTAETFTGLARMRGIECRAPSGFAEAFHVRKARLAAV